MNQTHYNVRNKYQGHTPGPWRTDNTGRFRSGSVAITRIIAHDGKRLSSASIRWNSEADFRLAQDAPALLARVARLEEALADIAEFCTDHPHDNAQGRFLHIKDTARAALAEKE